jgi:hypothetical protein
VRDLIIGEVVVAGTTADTTPVGVSFFVSVFVLPRSTNDFASRARRSLVT